MTKEQREKKIAGYIEKGAEWMSQELIRNENLIKHLKKQLDKEYALGELKRKTRILEEINENMRAVISENGIKLKHLTVEYEYRDCENCENSIRSFVGGTLHYECNSDESFEGECPFATGVKKMSYWTFEVRGNNFFGIDSFFRDEDLRIIRVIDDDIKKVIFERKNEENNESDWRYNNE